MADVAVFFLVTKIHTATFDHNITERSGRTQSVQCGNTNRSIEYIANKTRISLRITATILIWQNIIKWMRQRRTPFIIVQFFNEEKNHPNTNKVRVPVWFEPRVHLIGHYSQTYKIITEMEYRLRVCVCVRMHYTHFVNGVCVSWKGWEFHHINSILSAMQIVLFNDDS